MYRTLDPGMVIGTAERLRARVEERFPGSSLPVEARIKRERALKPLHGY